MNKYILYSVVYLSLLIIFGVCLRNGNIARSLENDKFNTQIQIQTPIAQIQIQTPTIPQIEGPQELPQEQYPEIQEQPQSDVCPPGGCGPIRKR